MSLFKLFYHNGLFEGINECGHWGELFKMDYGFFKMCKKLQNIATVRRVNVSLVRKNRALIKIYGK